MASFKILRGLSAKLPSNKTDGLAYFCTDTGDLYIDYKDSSGVVQRKLVNGDALSQKAALIHAARHKTGGADAIAPADIGAAKASDLTSHVNNRSNPHGVNLTQLGVTASATEVNILDGITASTAELNYVKGATDNIQTQLNAKAKNSDLTAHTSNTVIHVTAEDKEKWNTAHAFSQLEFAPSDAEKNQNAFSNIKVGSTTVAADTATDTVTFVGSNVTITPDATNDKITFAVASGSTSTAGILQLTNSTSSTSTTTAATPSSVKSAYDLANTAKNAAATAQATADGKANASHTHTVANISDLTATATELNYMDGVTSNVQTQLDGKSASGHGHSDATTSAAGFMTAAMVTKLNGISTGANKTTVDSSLSSSSTNPVQNKVVNSAISTLTSSVSANTSSISSHTTAISNLQTAVSEIQEITSEEIQNLFA